MFQHKWQQVNHRKTAVVAWVNAAKSISQTGRQVALATQNSEATGAFLPSVRKAAVL